MSYTTVFAKDSCYCVDPYLELGDRYILFASESQDKASYISFSACATQPYNEERAIKIKEIAEQYNKRL